MAQRQILGTHEKALQVNLDPPIYGSFAEIGAGQEVARWFFRVGGASGTVAKSMSAYDMIFSDAIYGTSERYVSKKRLLTMLDHEYNLLIERLNEQRGSTTTFFVFADTVAAKSFSRNDDGHGWLGVRFQSTPLTPPNDILLHVRLLDNNNVAQQEALGILGANLIYGAFYYSARPEELIESLLDGLSVERIEVDMIKFSGPKFAGLDNRVMSLHLVKLNLTDAALLGPDGEVLQPSDFLHKKPILLERGKFKPITLTHLDMLERARKAFMHDLYHSEEVVELMEITMNDLFMNELATGGQIDHSDFLARADLLGSLGKTVLISDYGTFHRLARYLFRYTKEKIGIVVGIPLLKEIFNEKYYADLEGGILESFGRLFRNSLTLYVYPGMDTDTGYITTATTLQVSTHLRDLYQHLLHNGYIQSIENTHSEYLTFSTNDAARWIAEGNPAWEAMVPGPVAEMIKTKKFFGYR